MVPNRCSDGPVVDHGPAHAIPALLVALGMTATLPAGATFGQAGNRPQQAAILLDGVVDEGGTRVVVEPGTLLAPDLALGRAGDVVPVRALTPVTLLVLAAGDLRAATSDPDVKRWLAEQPGCP